MDKRRILDNAYKQLEPSYHAINFILGIILFSTGISFFFREGFLFTAIVDLTAAFASFLIHVFRHRIPLRNKMLLTVTMCQLFALQSLYRGGFIGNGLIALVIVVVLSIAFLEKKNAILNAVIATSILILMTIFQITGILDIHRYSSDRLYETVDWVYQSIAFMVFVLVAYHAIITIRELLIESIGKLERNMETLELQSKALEEHQKQLERLAYEDKLTGLYNRNYFFDIPTIYEEYYGKKVIVAVLDIKNFKLINAIYGTDKGDEFLIRIADYIKGLIREGMMISRVGSNEFAFVAFDGNLENMKDLVDIGVAKLAKNSMNFSINASFIMAYTEFDFTKENYLEAIRNLNATLKFAKETGLVGLIPYTDEICIKERRESELMERIGSALIKDEFQVYFQGKYSVDDQRIVGYEVLARWFSTDHKPISPMVFIPVVEKAGLVDEFSSLIIMKAFNDFAKIQSRTKIKLTISLNISPLYLFKNELISFLEEGCKDYSISPEQVILEITEDVLINDYTEATKKIHELRNMGYKISLDDFGTGYSSLNYLNEFNIDELKIDKVFLRNIVENKRAQQIVKSLVDMATALGYKLVAEGVETKEQLDVVCELGCPVIQGFYFSKPIDCDSIIESLSEHS